MSLFVNSASNLITLIGFFVLSQIIKLIFINLQLSLLSTKVSKQPSFSRTLQKKFHLSIHITPRLIDFYKTNFPILLSEVCTGAATTWKLFVSCTRQVNARKQNWLPLRFYTDIPNPRAISFPNF